MQYEYFRKKCMKKTPMKMTSVQYFVVIFKNDIEFFYLLNDGCFTFTIDHFASIRSNQLVI